MKRDLKNKHLSRFIIIVLTVSILFHLQINASEIFNVEKSKVATASEVSSKVNDKSIIGREYEIGTVINSDEKMKWIVIDYDKENPSKVFLATKDIIEYREYHDDRTNYKNSKIRYYLNKEFYEKNFSKEEQKHILSSDIQISLTMDNIIDGAVEKINTNDKIFLLSVEEALNYISINKEIKENVYAESIYPWERTNDDVDFAFWTRDIINYKKPVLLISPQVQKGVDVYAYQGIVAGMWYDFSINKSDEEFINECEKFNERILFERKDETRTKKFEEIKFGTYHWDKNYTWRLSWYIVGDDEKEIKLLSKDIIEYMEIEYDTYDEDKLAGDPYAHSNLKRYINEDLYDNIFDDEEKDIIIQNEDEKMTIPDKNDIYSYDLLNENATSTLLKTYGCTIINTKKYKYYYKNFSKRYFVNMTHEHNGLSYLMSLLQDVEEFRVSYDDTIDEIGNKDIVTCSGIRLVIKVKKDKLMEYLNKRK